jgi:hypothetical protein
MDCFSLQGVLSLPILIVNLCKHLDECKHVVNNRSLVKSKLQVVQMGWLESNGELINVGNERNKA